MHEDARRFTGLMDWGRVGQLNVAFALWGCLGGAPLEVWDNHLEELLALFSTEFAARAGRTSRRANCGSIWTFILRPWAWPG